MPVMILPVYMAPVLLLSLLAGCGTTGPEQSSPTGVFRFQCGMINVQFRPETDGVAHMHIDNRSWHMQQTRSASGARYEASDNPAIVFWDKGDRAMLTLDGVEQPQCMQIHPADHYAASGNEPGWILHVSGRNLVLISDYGNRYTLATLQDDEDGTEHRRITARDGNDSITVHIIKQACRDDMSGETFPHQVNVMQGGRHLRGCGGNNTLAAGEIEGVTWHLDQRGIIDRSHLTLRLETDGHMGGSSGCNNYMAKYRREGTLLIIDPPITATRRACVTGALMMQEQRYLEMLGRINHLHLDNTGMLILSNDMGENLTFGREE